jgi:hypothetical protein
MDADEYVATYPAGGDDAVAFQWNGKHSSEFVDSNYVFRKAVVNHCLANPDLSPPGLLAVLLSADAAWSREAWCAPNHFGALASLLLVRCSPEVLPLFARSMNASFDTFGASHEIDLPEPILEAHLVELRRLVSSETNAEIQTQLASALELFEKLAKGTANEGWAKVSPGTPVTNIRIVYPRWYHRLWQQLCRWFGVD